MDEEGKAGIEKEKILMKWVGIWLVLVTPACAWEGLNKQDVDKTYDPYEGMVLVCEGNSRENADCEYVDQDELRRRIPTSIRGIRL